LVTHYYNIVTKLDREKIVKDQIESSLDH
jgi:hypothetical protein